MKNNIEEIKKSFGIQSKRMSEYHMSKSEYTDYLIKKINAEGTEHSLDVAAGTCICSRALSPHIKDIVCLDMTDEMLAEGKKLAEKENLTNLSFVCGNAEALPFADSAFDLVITRLSLHHFINPEISFYEMKRVLKSGGRLVIWDMVAVSEKLRDTDDSIERMRDTSHIKILSRSELEKLFDDNFTIEVNEVTSVPVELNAWMRLTDTPENVKSEITALMTAEINGGSETGFFPYPKDGKIFFDHHWLLLIGKKS